MHMMRLANVSSCFRLQAACLQLHDTHERKAGHLRLRSRSQVCDVVRRPLDFSAFSFIIADAALRFVSRKFGSNLQYKKWPTLLVSVRARMTLTAAVAANRDPLAAAAAATAAAVDHPSRKAE